MPKSAANGRGIREDLHRPYGRALNGGSLPKAQDSSCVAGRLPFAFLMGCLPAKGGAGVGTTKALQQSAPSNSLERAAYTIAEFCYRNKSVVRPTIGCAQKGEVRRKCGSG